MHHVNDLIDFKEIIFYMPGNVYWTDLEGVYQGCNENVIRILGNGCIENIIGKKLNELIDDNRSAELTWKTDTSVMTNNQPITLEEEGLDADGKLAYYFTRKSTLTQ